MTSVKRTRCPQCGTTAKCRLLELMWRWDGRGAWTWISGFMCPPCRATWLDWIDQLGDQVLALDG